MKKQSDNTSSQVRDGLLFGLFAYLLWGFFPAYMKIIDDVSPMEILAHRILWSIPFGAVLISLRNQWGEVSKAIHSRKVVLLLAVSAIAISLNWLIYVWAVINDRVLEASLGYYINPLMYVGAGILVLGEKLRPAQLIAVALAAIGVAVLTFGAGVFPWVSLSLAVLFTIYGYIRKTTPVGAMPGLFIETLLLAPIALFYLLWLLDAGQSIFMAQSPSKDVLLALLGPLTVGPLVLFALAARRLKLSTLGFLQYIAPSIQFGLGIFYGETFTFAHAVCFGLIWTALAIFSVDAIKKNRSEAAGRAA